MATKIDTEKLIDVSSPLEESLVVDNVNQYQGLKSDNEDDFASLSFDVNGDDLVIRGNSILGTDKTITIKGYGKANGKSKFDYLVEKDGDDLTVVGNLIADSLVDNNNHYEASTLVDEETGKFSYTVNTSAFNDTVNLSGFQAADAEEDYYIKKGFTVNTNQGNDTVTGSVLADTIKTGDGNDDVIASTGDDKYTLGKGENTLTYTAANFTGTGFGNDTVNLTKGEELAVAHTYTAEQVETYVKGKDVVVDAYSKSTVGYNKTEVSFDTEAHRNYFDTAKVVTNDGGTVDLKVTVEDSVVTSVKVYDATAEGDDKYVNATETYKNYVNATAGYQRLYVVLDEDEAIESAHVVASSEEDFADHTSLTYLTTTQDYHAVANAEEKTVDWEESGAAMYAASETGKVGETHKYIYSLAGTYGEVKKVTYADLTKKYIVKDTAVTEYEYDDGWTLGENTTHTYNVVSKKGTDSTTLYEVITAQNGKTVLNVVTAEDIEESEYEAEVLYVIKDDKLKDGSVTIKNAAGGTAKEISINTLDVLNDAFNVIDVPTKGNKINGTALGDVVTLGNAYDAEKGTGYVVNTGAGNDEITGSKGDDTITAGAGENTINVSNGAAFGKDTINLTKGEDLTLNFATDLDIEGEDPTATISVDGKDVVITNGVNGTVTFKGLAAKDLVGEDGAVLVDNIGDVRDLARHDVELTTKNTKFTGTYLGADVTVALGEGEESVSKNLTVDLSKSQHANQVDLTGSTGKNTVKGGTAADDVTGGAGDDTVTLGKGENSLTNAGLGKDVVNLTKDEDLTVVFTDNESIDWKVVKNDVVVNTLDGEGHELGSVTFKNYAAKDPDADVTLDLDEDVALDQLDFATTWSDAENAVAEAGETIVTSKTKSFTGSRLNDVVDASDFTLYKKVNGEDVAIDTEDEKYKTTLKGVTVNAKDGANSFEGSIYADTYKGGVDNDTITASLGNDTYTLGAGANVADYTAAAEYDNDTYNLTNDEDLLLKYANETVLTYSKVGNDIIVSEGADDQVTLKNLATGKVDADVSVQIGNDAAANIWTKTINIEATSAKVTGTFGNDKFNSDRAAGTTFVESYTDDKGFNEDNDIVVNLDDGVKKKAADTIQITTSDKAADKLSAYEFDYNYDDETKTLNVVTEKGNISYTSDDYSKGLNLVDATGTKWAFYNDTLADEYDESTGDINYADLQKAKTNIIAQIDEDGADIIDSKKNDIIIGAGAGQSFTYTAGKDLYKGGEGDDTYKFTLDKKTTLVVSDNAGDNILDLTTSKNSGFGLFFNVNADGSIDVDDDDKSDLMIIDKATYAKATVKTAQSLFGDSAKGVVGLEDAITATTEGEGEEATTTYSVDSFQIKKDGASAADINIDDTRAAVASWLADHDTYASAFDAILAGDKTDVASLMAVYATGEYTA